MRMLIGCVLAALTIGCASTESARPTPPVAKSAAVQPEMKPVTQEETRQVKLDKSNIAEAQAAGYKIVDKEGKRLLCRKELQTGSHVQYKTSCLTEQEWFVLEQSSRETVQGMARRVQPPVVK